MQEALEAAARRHRQQTKPWTSDATIHEEESTTNFSKVSILGIERNWEQNVKDRYFKLFYFTEFKNFIYIIIQTKN